MDRIGISVVIVIHSRVINFIARLHFTNSEIVGKLEQIFVNNHSDTVAGLSGMIIYLNDKLIIKNGLYANLNELDKLIKTTIFNAIFFPMVNLDIHINASAIFNYISKGNELVINVNAITKERLGTLL